MKRFLTTRLLAFMAVIAISFGAIAPSLEAQSAFVVTLENRSNFAIYHAYLSPVNRDIWGPDQLGSVILYTNQYYTLLDGFRPGYYDLKLVDNDGDKCVVTNVRINGNTTWSITNAWLLSCEFHNAQ